MQKALQHALFHHNGLLRGGSLRVEGTGIERVERIVHDGDALRRDCLADFSRQHRHPLVRPVCVKETGHGLQQIAQRLIGPERAVFSRRHGTCPELACRLPYCLGGAALHIEGIGIDAVARAVVYFLTVLEYCRYHAVGNPVNCLGAQAAGIGNAHAGACRTDHIVLHPVGAGIGCEHCAFKCACQLDFFGLRHGKHRVCRHFYLFVDTFPLHRMLVGRGNGRCVVQRTGHQAGCVLEHLRIGIAVAPVLLHPQSKAAVTADGVGIHFLLVHAHLEGVTLLEVHLRRAPGLCSLGKQQITKLFKLHYSAPPLPPMVISRTRILGCPTFVGIEPD